MKKIYLLLMLMVFGSYNAQLDTEHWFAPFAGSTSQNGQLYAESYLYLSTNETIPFNVEIFQGNVLFTTVQVSKGNPQVVDIPFNKMISADLGDMFKPVSMGLYVKGTKRFFANYRFIVPNHAEIITSKGLAGVGKTFFAAMARTSAPKTFVTSTIGIIATEDNTNVTISGYDPGIIFFDGTTTPTKTFTLNRGESYIVNVISADAPANLEGLIGAKIEADRPIGVTNGNFNGIYTNENSSNNDILMDQSVPVERLGNEFVLVKGNGPPFNNMESGLIVATEDNTTLIINGVSVPITLNEGEYFIADSPYYKDQGNGHYNMSIKSSKNIYLYQLLAGVESGLIYATGGFNFIPALSCFLPNKIDEISDINRIGFTYYNAKLNIITEAGATVNVNGTTLAGTEGPFQVTGNPGWVTYNVLNVTGNITVTSTKSVTAGIASGDGAVGYGGYFAGFSSVPVISRTGDCFSGVLLQVDDSYDQYKWYLNGVLLPTETTYSLNPQQYGSGDYTCIITKTNCDTKLTTPYQFLICAPISTSKYIIGSCKSIVIQPNFTTSTQTIVPSKTKIRVQGTSGTATINATTGIITYIPSASLTTNISDFFVYYIEGNGTPEDSEFFKVTIDLKVLGTNDAILKVCPNADGTGTYNLTSAQNSNDPNNIIQYFSDIALTQPIQNFTNFTTLPKTVYAKILSLFGCEETANIDLQLAPIAQINLSNFNPTFCDDNFDGNATVKFSDFNTQIISNFTSDFIVKYYLNSSEQQTGASNFLPNDFSYATNTLIYFRIENIAGCTTQFGQFELKIGNSITLLTSIVSTSVCDNALTGNIAVQLEDYKSFFTTDTAVTSTYYRTRTDAQLKLNPISSTQALSQTEIYYVRFESATECPTIGELTIVFKSPKKSTDLIDQTICPTAETILEAGLGFDSYLWSTGENTSSISAPVGEYYVDLGFNGCIYRQNVTIFASELPVIGIIEVTGNTATVAVTRGTPPYLYSIDNGPFQSSNVFQKISRGIHTINVTDSQNCKTVNKDFLIINLINVITPNDDGYNDALDYSELKIKKDVKIEIYNRFGAAVFQTQKEPFIWDGKSNGRAIATGTYWYVLQWTEPDTGEIISYKGWVLLKNRN